MSDTSSAIPDPAHGSRADDLPAVGDGHRPPLKGFVPPPPRPTAPPIDLAAPVAAATEGDGRPLAMPAPSGRPRWRRWRRRTIVVAALVAVTMVGALVARSFSGGPHVVRSLRVGGHPIGITSDGTSVWVVGDEDGGPVRRIDPRRVVVTGDVAVGKAPYGITATSDAVWVANGLGNSVSRIDVAGGTSEFPLGGAPYDVVTSSSAPQSVFVSLGTGTVDRVDETGRVVADYEIGGAARGLAVDGSSLWVAVAPERSGPRGPGQAQAVLIDLEQGEVVGSVPLAGSPDDIAIGHGSVWVTDVTGGSVFRIDPEEMELVGTIDVGSGPQGIVAPESGVWVTLAGSDEVVRVDPDSGKVTDRVPTRREPVGIVAVGNDLWVADHSDGTVEFLSTS